jgi:hypothetical protein
VSFFTAQVDGIGIENFVRDEYMMPIEVDDGNFSTSRDLKFKYGEVAVWLPRDWGVA